MARTEPYISAPPDAAEAPYEGIGAQLRAAREAAAQSVDMVASSLRIRRPHIQAIEDGRHEDLPGQVYAIGFVRAYAEFLHLDADLVVERFREESDGPSTKLELHFPEPASRRGRLDMRALLVGLIIAVSAYGTWNYVQTRDQLPRELVANVPPNLLIATAENPASEPPKITEPFEAGASARSFANSVRSGMTSDAGTSVNDASDLSEPTPTQSAEAMGLSPQQNPFQGGVPARMTVDTSEFTAGGASPQAAEPGPLPSEEAVSAVMVAMLAPEAAPVAATASDSEPSPTSSVVAGIPPVATDVEEPESATSIVGALAEIPPVPPLSENARPAVPTVPSADYEPRIYGQGNTDARVVVRARIESWVQVEGSDNELLLTRVLNPGDMFLVPNRTDLHLVTGNAGGIDILVDGVLMPPLGPEGTVRRNVRLTPDALTGADTVSSR